MTKKFVVIFNTALTVFERFRLFFFLPLFIFILLFIKDPFSDRSLIPNFEPFPDSFHYILPARCFITSGSWSLCRPETTGRSSDVGPLYSIVFIPFFLIVNDPRMFYFANVGLSLGSFYLLYRLFSNLKIPPLIQFSVLLLAATRYHLYWFPTLAMAENLILFLFLLNVWIVQKKSLWIQVFGIIAALGFYAAKYAYAPLTMIFLLVHMFTIYQHSKKPSKWVLALIVAVGLGCMVLILKTQLILSLFGLNFFRLTLTDHQAQVTWFSLAFIPKHFIQYISALFGSPSLVLWDTRELFPWFLSWLAVGGLVAGAITKKYRLLSVVTLMGVLFQILFISSFYSFDSRYILHIIYSLLIGLAISLTMITNKLENRYKQYGQLIILILSVIVTATQAQTLRTQVVVNLKYAETPWYYMATKEIDLSISPIEGKKVLISAMPVYFFDFFGTRNYVVLPMSQEQERQEKKLVYGKKYEYGDLPALYKEFLNNGYHVFISNYGLGNEGYMHESYKLITDTFPTQLISEGCYGACNVYQLTLTEK